MRTREHLGAFTSSGGLVALAALVGCGGAGGRAAGGTTPAGEVVGGEPTEVAASTDTARAAELTPAVIEPPPPPELAGAVHRRRYGLTSATQSLVADRGEGYDGLYGTRNLRAVLNGVFYRGGANNAFHRGGKRNNKNPLPPDGLDNLCRQGFGSAIYLYPTRYKTAAPETTCETVDGGAGHLVYEQISTQHGKKADLRKVFEEILLHVHEPERGPIYMHCWNGWHASGFLAAVTLRQFCGFTSAQALRYWTVTAKGASSADHADTKKRIEKFKPFPEYAFSDEERAALCPDPKSLSFAPSEPTP